MLDPVIVSRLERMELKARLIEFLDRDRVDPLKIEVFGVDELWHHTMVPPKLAMAHVLGIAMA